MFIKLLYNRKIIYYYAIKLIANNQGSDFDDMSSFFPCEIDDAIQYVNLGYAAQAPKIFYSAFFVILCRF